MLVRFVVHLHAEIAMTRFWIFYNDISLPSGVDIYRVRIDIVKIEADKSDFYVGKVYAQTFKCYGNFTFCIIENGDPLNATMVKRANVIVIVLASRCKEKAYCEGYDCSSFHFLDTNV